MSDWQERLQEQADKKYEQWLQKRPICKLCESPIQTQFAYNIFGDWVCEDCFTYLNHHGETEIDDG